MRCLRSNWRIILLYLALLAVGIPWYWPADDRSVWFGIPAWVAVALLVSITVSVITTIILLRYRWPGESDEPDK